MAPEGGVGRQGDGRGVLVGELVVAGCEAASVLASVEKDLTHSRERGPPCRIFRLWPRVPRMTRVILPLRRFAHNQTASQPKLGAKRRVRLGAYSSAAGTIVTSRRCRASASGCEGSRGDR